MATPGENQDAEHLLRMLEDAGVEVSAVYGDGSVTVIAADNEGHVYNYIRDDENIGAALLHLMGRLGWQDLD